MKTPVTYDTVVANSLTDGGKDVVGVVIAEPPCAERVPPEEGRKVASSPGDCFELPVTRAQLLVAQKEDKTLVRCFSAVVSREEADAKRAAYFLDDSLLMRKWTFRTGSDRDWSTMYQIVMPMAFRYNILSLAHDIPWAGHLGITKPYNRVLRHFF